MYEYTLTFQLTKHKNEHKFKYVFQSKDLVDELGLKEEKAMYFEDKYRTPVRCVKVERRVV